MLTYLTQCQYISWMEKHADTDLHIQAHVCECRSQRGHLSHHQRKLFVARVKLVVTKDVTCSEDSSRSLPFKATALLAYPTTLTRCSVRYSIIVPSNSFLSPTHHAILDLASKHKGGPWELAST